MSAPHSDDVPDSRRPVTRDEGVKYRDILQPRNTFGGQQLYYSTVENSIFLANERWKVEAEYQDLDGNSLRTVPPDHVGRFFDGEYQGGPYIPAGEQLRMHLTFPNEPGNKYPGGYAYGYFILSFYSSRTAPISDVDLQVYCTHEGQGVGWKTISLEEISDPKQSSSFSVLAGYSNWHGPSDVVLTIKNTSTDESYQTRPTEFEFYNTRPMNTDTPMVSKYRDESLYRRLSWYSGWDRNAYVDEDGTAEFRALRSGSGPTADRPTGVSVGTQYFDTTLSLPIWYAGSGNWVDATGTTV